MGATAKNCRVRQLSLEPLKWTVQVTDNQNDKFAYDQLTATSIELMVRLGMLGLLLYWSFILLRPFITIAIWSVVLTVALYPAYNCLVLGSAGGEV